MSEYDLVAIRRSLEGLECVSGVSLESWTSGTGRVRIVATTRLFEESRSDRNLVYDAECNIISGHPEVEFEFHCVVDTAPELPPHGSVGSKHPITEAAAEESEEGGGDG